MTGVAAAAAAAAAASLKPLTVVCVPTAVAGVWDSELGVGVTDQVTAIPDGGLAPYSFSWAKVSGFSFGITNASGQYTSFTFSGATQRSAVYRVTVTDALGLQDTSDVDVTAN